MLSAKLQIYCSYKIIQRILLLILGSMPQSEHIQRKNVNIADTNRISFSCYQGHQKGWGAAIHMPFNTNAMQWGIKCLEQLILSGAGDPVMTRWVGPIDNRPSTKSFITSTHTHTKKMWHGTHEMWKMKGGEHFLKILAPYLLRFVSEGVLKIFSQRTTEWLTTDFGYS